MAEQLSVPSRRDGPQKTIVTSRTVLVLLMFVPFLIQAATYLKLLFELIFVRNDTGYPEGACVYAFVTAARTGHLYSDPFQLPLNVQLYGPVFYLIGAVLAKAAHGDLLLTAEFARALSLLSFLGSVVLVGYLSWKLERLIHWTIVATILCVGCTWAIPYVASARPESLSFLLILSAVTVYQLARGRNSVVFWAGVLGSLSILTKQSTAPVLFALLIDSLLARRPGKVAALVGGSLPIPALISLIMWVSHEQFLANFVAIGHAAISWPSVPNTLMNLLRTNQAAIIPLSIALVGAAVSWRKERYRAILLAAAFGCVSNVAALSNLGGYGHYLILPWLLMMTMIPAGLVQLEGWARRSVLIPIGLTLLSVMLLIHQRSLLTRKPPADIDIAALSGLKILSDMPYLEMNSRQPQLLDPFFYHDLSLQNLWSFAPINEQIDKEEFDLVLISGGDGGTASEFSVAGFRGVSYWGQEALDSIGNHYQLLCEVQEHLTFVPRNRPVNLQDKDLARIFKAPCRASDRIPQLTPGLH